MLVEAAAAKLNLGLAVTARRGDGFHEIDTVFARLQLADELSAERSSDGFSLRIHGETGVPGGSELLTADNLVLLAAEAFARASGVPGASFLLTKRIPVAAGLGGGSADAAAALRLLARLYPDEAEQVDLAELGRQLGSDVPFQLLDIAAAHGRGRGERLSPLSLPERQVVLANPGVPVKAGAAYGWLQTFSRRLQLNTISDALTGFTEPRWLNALQAGVSREVKEVRTALSELRSEGLQGVLMSGSGPTCFGLAADQAAAERAAENIRSRQPGWWVHTDVIGGS